MKRRDIRRKKNDKGAPKWMVTYSDMVTLILVFFILLFSMSQIDLVKFEAISESFRNRMIFDFYPSPVPMENPTENTSEEESGENSNEFEFSPDIDSKDKDDDPDNAKDGEPKEDSLDKLMHDIETYLDQHNLNHVITANRTEQGVVLVLQERILFESAQAEILDAGKPFLTKIGNLIAKMPNHVKVEGHTDSRPISNYRYPSNWELSGARASSVIRFLIDQNNFNEARFSAVGYGDTRPRVENSSQTWSQNRRVEIVILEENANN